MKITKAIAAALDAHYPCGSAEWARDVEDGLVADTMPRRVSGTVKLGDEDYVYLGTRITLHVGTDHGFYGRWRCGGFRGAWCGSLAEAKRSIDEKGSR